MRCWIAVLLGVCVLSHALGCAGFSEFHSEQVARRRATRPRTTQLDSLWKQGYGFNNPNNDRRRQGLELVNFDGKTDRERRKGGGYFGSLFGDMLLYGTKSIGTSIANMFRR